MTYSEFNRFLSHLPDLSPEQIRQLQAALTETLAQRTAFAPMGATLSHQARRRRNHRPIKIKGKPLSETIIEERR